MGSENIFKVFLDINIVIDIIDRDRPNNKIAAQLLYSLTSNNITIVISEDMLSTIYYIEKDKKRTLEFFNVIQENWKIKSFGKSVVNDAINLSLKNHLDFEDLLQCFCAKDNNCDLLITNDKKFYNCGIDIYDISSFLEKYEN